MTRPHHGLPVPVGVFAVACSISVLLRCRGSGCGAVSVLCVCVCVAAVKFFCCGLAQSIHLLAPHGVFRVCVCLWAGPSTSRSSCHWLWLRSRGTNRQLLGLCFLPQATWLLRHLAALRASLSTRLVGEWGPAWCVGRHWQACPFISCVASWQAGRVFL